jgi:tRNA (cytidine/uridine-2'-O-)-methyltransferase
MLNIVLFEPEIPPNTGNIIRLCANAGARLHLIHPLGFNLNEKAVRRAGLDYSEFTQVIEYENYAAFIEKNPASRIFACTTKGAINHSDAEFQAHDFLLFGPETRGLPESVLSKFEANKKIRIPMQPHSRSLNLSNSCAIILYEAWRQCEYR